MLTLLRTPVPALSRSQTPPSASAAGLYTSGRFVLGQNVRLTSTASRTRHLMPVRINIYKLDATPNPIDTLLVKVTLNFTLFLFNRGYFQTV